MRAVRMEAEIAKAGAAHPDAVEDQTPFRRARTRAPIRCSRRTRCPDTTAEPIRAEALNWLMDPSNGGSADSVDAEETKPRKSPSPDA